MKKIFALLLFLFLIVCSTGAFASKIPDGELKVLKEAFPTLNVRFDGLIELQDGTNYIPVYPVQSAEVSSVQVKKTVPAKSLKDKPDFVMFNTNLALFKIINQNGKSTILYNKDIPEDIKMSILPQDLLVPPGFQIPEPLRIIIGNLIIPVIPTNNYSEKSVLTGKVTQSAPKVKLVEKTAQQLTHKYFYTTNFKTNVLSILNADSGKAFKEIEFSSIPSDMKLTSDGKYLLVSTLRNGVVFVIDTHKTKVLKELKAGEKPVDIVVSNTNNLAYVANRGENTISVIDLKTMQMLDAINVIGHPTYLEMSADNNVIYYLDSITGKVYSLTKQDDHYNPYVTKALFKTNNISKIQLANDKIYTLDRGKNTLDIYYLKGKPDINSTVEASDITPVKLTKEEENGIENTDEKVAVLDYDYYNDKKSEDVPFKTEKTSLKQKTNKLIRQILYYPEDYKKPQPPNPNNLTQVYTAKSLQEEKDKEQLIAESIGLEEKQLTDKEIIEEDLSKAEQPKHKKSAKEIWQDFLNYKAVEEPKNEAEIIKIAVDKQMDFIGINNRVNDFMVVNDKIYLLCADNYALLVYDATTQKLITSIELPQKGYYNALKISNNKKVGIITNISTKEMILFDTAENKILQKLPLTVNVHNVVITGR